MLHMREHLHASLYQLGTTPTPVHVCICKHLDLQGVVLSGQSYSGLADSVGAIQLNYVE